MQTAQGATLMSTTHLCLKTYYVRDRLGKIRPIVVKACVVPGLKYDLLPVKGLNIVSTRVIMQYTTTQIHRSRAYLRSEIALTNNLKKLNKAKSFPFMSEHSRFLNIKLEQMSAKHFAKQSGYELWQQRLVHASFRNIRDTIEYVNGLESLKHMTCVLMSNVPHV